MVVVRSGLAPVIDATKSVDRSSTYLIGPAWGLADYRWPVGFRLATDRARAPADTLATATLSADRIVNEHRPRPQIWARTCVCEHVPWDHDVR